MTEINKAGDNHSIGHIDIPQGKFREQMDAVADSLRQLAGESEVERGHVVNDPLNSPFVLYVNGYTGTDTYVSGAYSTKGANQEQRLRRISEQRLVCGYTEAQPFKTLERACIEAAIITAYDYWKTGDVPKQQVSIVVSPGEYIIHNGAGNENIVGPGMPPDPIPGPDDIIGIQEWCDGYVPTPQELQQFNPDELGGVILPRGCSVVSLDLRKTIFRPDFVPTPANENANYSNRRTIFRMTGQGYYYGFTFKDKEGYNQSHHLLSTFEFASKDQLDEYYAKIVTAVGDSTGIDKSELEPRESEYKIVGPQPVNPTEPTDTVESASPYIYNTSIRSVWGMCGVFLDGSISDGFKSTVMAQYTGVSLQSDMDNWELYSGKKWGPMPDYDTYISSSPNDIRAKVERRSFHIRAVNEAVVQEVSVFAIGQSIHHQVESGGEITITNSNSNWGGCAALAIGAHDRAFPVDRFHKVKFIERALDPIEYATVSRVKIGTVKSVDPKTELESTKILDKRYEDADYTIKAGTYVWVQNGAGKDWRAEVAEDVPKGDVTVIKLKRELEDESGNAAGDDAIGNDIYIRRLIDNRSYDERSYAILVQGDAGTRPPVRDYVPETATSNWDNRVSTVLSTVAVPDRDDVTAKVQLRYAKRPVSECEHQASNYYRPADTVIKDEKHFSANEVNYGPFEEGSWDESYVHMQEDYNPEGYYKNAAPVMVIDGDYDGNEVSADLGITLTTDNVRAQIRSATDYIGAHNLLRNLGVSNNEAHAMLDPAQIGENPLLNVNSRGWDLEFRRPSNIRLFGHAFEWTGFANYTKAVPKYQQFMTQMNKFTYYFTHEDGGRVYVSGFNEEGFLITNRGIQDLSTGDLVQLEQIGAPDVSLEPEPLPCATESNAGAVRLASQQQIEDALADPDCSSKTDSKKCEPAITVNDLCYIKKDIVGSVEQELLILPDEYANLFVHKDVERVVGADRATFVPDELTAAYIDKTDSNTRKLLTDEASQAAGYDGEDKVAFRTIWQAFHWVNNRAPVGKPALTCWVIGSQDPDPHPSADSPVNINAIKITKIKGYEQDHEKNKIYLKKAIRVGPNNVEFQLTDVTVSVGGTMATPETPYVPESTTVSAHGQHVEMTNVALINRSTTQSTCPFSQFDAPVTATCQISFKRDTKTHFIMDGKCNGQDTSNYSIITAVFKNLAINSGAAGTHTGYNYMKWAFRHTNANNTKALRIQAQAFNFNCRAYGNDPERQNGRLEWDLDFSGHQGEELVGLFPQARSRLVVEDVSGTVGNDLCDLKVNVLGLGKLKEIQLFGNRGAAENGMFYPVTDLYRSSKRGATPDGKTDGKLDGTWDDIDDYYNKTLTGRVAKAFRDAGHKWPDDGGGGTNGGYSFKLHPTMVYNNYYCDFGPVKYPNNVNEDAVGGFETGEEDSQGDEIDPTVINPQDGEFPNGKMLLE